MEDDSTVVWKKRDTILGAEIKRAQVDLYIQHVYYECAFGPQET